MNSLNQDDDITLTIKELLAIHNSLPSHDQKCERRCFLDVLQSLEESRTDSKLPHSYAGKAVRVEEGETVKFDND